MTNEQKYKTTEERISKFQRFCDKQEGCTKCAAVNDEGTRSSCAFHWLALEAEEEKPEPCFYCGNKYLAITKDGNNLWSVSCTACLYESRHHENRDTAISAHNRVFRAVEAIKKGAK